MSRSCASHRAVACNHVLVKNAATYLPAPDAWKAERLARRSIVPRLIEGSSSSNVNLEQSKGA